jgi:hypothetical protein
MLNDGTGKNDRPGLGNKSGLLESLKVCHFCGEIPPSVDSARAALQTELRIDHETLQLTENSSWFALAE